MNSFKDARDLFDPSAGARPYAKKVLVIISDYHSTSKEDNIIDMTELLHEDGIRIIAVPFGIQADSNQLEKITSTKKDVLPSRETDNPKKIADKIMLRALGKAYSHFFNFMFCKCIHSFIHLLLSCFIHVHICSLIDG